MILAVPVARVDLTPQQKAAIVVVTSARPRVFRGASGITFADQEGGTIRALPGSPPAGTAASYVSAAAAFAAGRDTARALRAAGIDVDFAPVLDTADGPLGSRQFDRPRFGVAFARGLGRAACAKHFPGLGSAAHSTDAQPHVEAKIRRRDLAPYREAIRQGLGCVMVGNAFYKTRFRGSLEPSIYRRLRSLGFKGIAITDSLSLVRDAPVERWAPQAIRAGADMVLFTNPEHARRAIRALLPLARRGELDSRVVKILRWRRGLKRS